MRTRHIHLRKIHYVLALFMALVAVAFWSSDSRGHAYLVRSEPSDGLILAEGPTDIRLWFDESISGKFSSARLIDPKGQTVKITSIGVAPDETTLMVISLPELSSGAYSLLYKALSETDGHFSQGLLVFGIGKEADMSTARAVETVSSDLPLPEVGLRWFNFVVLAGVVGAVFVALMVFGPSHTAANASPQVVAVLQSARRRAVGLALGFSIFGLVVGIGLLLWQTHQLMASLPEDANAINVGQQMLTGTGWGHSWLLRQLNLLLIVPVLIALFRRLSSPAGFLQIPVNGVIPGGTRQKIATGSSRRQGIMWLLATMLALTLVAAQSLSSHASGLEDNTLLALLADALHFLAASLWVGGLLAIALALLPLLARQRDELLAVIKSGFRPFSVVAVFSVAVLFATGFYNTGRQVASADALLTTFYGHALMVKVGVVVLVGATGLLNSILLHPRLSAPLARVFRRPSGWTPLPLSRLPTVVVIEVSLGMLVMLIAGVVTASPTPRGIEYAFESKEVPGSLSRAIDDLVITLSAKPNRPGQNVFNVFARSTRRPPPAEIARVILRFEYLGRDIGRTSAVAEQVAPDRFILGGNYLNLSGKWQIRVVVRRLGREDSVAKFNWMVLPAGKSRPVVVSREPLEPVMTFLAAAMLLLVAMAAATTVTIRWVVGRRKRGVLQNVDKPQERIAFTKSTSAHSKMNGLESDDLSRTAWKHEIPWTKRAMVHTSTAQEEMKGRMR